MVEPFASDRLRLVLGSPAFAASHLALTHVQPPPAGGGSPSPEHAPSPPPAAAGERETPLLAALEPPARPGAALAGAIAACTECRDGARCPAHEAQWRDERWRDELARHRRGERFAAGYAEFRDRALAAPPVATGCLALLRTQDEALALVWEAHARGAVQLPAPVLEAVLAARRAGRERVRGHL